MQASARLEPQWRLGFQTLEAEHRDPIRLVTHGQIPAELFGTLYRNGPAQHDVYGERFRHWFDGDGMIHAFALSAAGVEYRNRFVSTEGRAQEISAGRRIWGAFATRPAGGPLRRYLHRGRGKNAAN